MCQDWVTSLGVVGQCCSIDSLNIKIITITLGYPPKKKPENVNNGFRSDATASDLIVSEDKQTFLHSISNIFLYSSASFLFLLF